jgi:hypothetical protein
MILGGAQRTGSRAADAREVAHTHAGFRDINERLTSDDPVADVTAGHVISCECADPTCLKTIAISEAQWQELCREPRRFAVLPGHVYPDVEYVVSEFETYVVVEKLARLI